MENSPEKNLTEIKLLDDQTARRICSSQAIPSMQTAVQQLIENAIDANASCITIRFANFGRDLFEMIDNGQGIEKKNFNLLGKRNCTSKLNFFEDMQNVNTFGFRGEALNSLCNIAHVSVCTRHASESLSTILTFDSKGNVISQDSKARDVGTTVTVSQLFYSLPVRRKEFVTNYRRVYDHTLALIYQYCVGIVGLKIFCFHKPDNNSNYSRVFTSSGISVQRNIIEIFQLKQFENLMPFVCHTDLDDPPDEPIKIDITGFISKPDTNCGRPSQDRQFLYVNERPCDLAAVSKRINQIYRTYNRNQYPFFLLKLTADERLIDRNLTPDKRKIFLADNHYIFRVIQHSLERMFARESVDVKSLTSSQILTKFLNTPLKRTLTVDNSMEAEVSKVFKRCSSPCDSSFLDDSFRNDSHNRSDELSLSNETDSKRDNFGQQANDSNFNSIYHEAHTNKSFTPIRHPFFNSINNFNQNLNSNTSSNNIVDTSNENSKSTTNEVTLIEDISKPQVLEVSNNLDLNKIDHDNAQKISLVNEKLNGSVNEEILKRKRIFFQCNIKDICNKYSSLYDKSVRNSQNEDIVNFNANISSPDNEVAINELRHTLTKRSFTEMQVIGQFNKSFIIAKMGSNLFILDQHAMDERYNFEKFLNDPKVVNQTFVCPLRLRLSSINESIVFDNMETFKKLGFGIKRDDNATIGQRLLLTQVPMSTKWVAGLSDVEEIIAAIRDSPTGNILEGKHFMLSDLRHEIASRACRSSIMIGDALPRSKMIKLLAKMVDLRDPWHCAHNRPTIRHLFALHPFKLSC